MLSFLRECCALFDNLTTILFFFLPASLSDRSQNGSPIDQYDPGDLVITVKKPRRAANGKVIAPSIPINIGIGAGNGETIDLSDPNQRKNMDGEQKAHAMQQLMAMQEQMKNLMADW